MGTWAAGVFENDASLDLVSDVADEVKKEMAPPDSVEDTDQVLAAVAILKVLVEHCHVPPPELAEIESLKVVVLDLYDKEIDGLDPDEDFKVQRRGVIERTFDEFIAPIKWLVVTAVGLPLDNGGLAPFRSGINRGRGRVERVPDVQGQRRCSGLK